MVNINKDGCFLSLLAVFTIDYLNKIAYNLSRNILLLSTANNTFVTLNLHIYISKIIFEPFGSSISLYD